MSLPKGEPTRPASAAAGRVDGGQKVTGRMIYAADVAVPGLLHAVAVRSPYPHARIVAVDTAVAADMPGVRCVLVGADLPQLRYGRLVQDVPALAVDKVRFAGERVAVVAADTRRQAEAAAAAIGVTYEPLPAVLDPEAALAPGAPAVHDQPWAYAGTLVAPDGPPNLQARHEWTGGGDVTAALAAADLCLEQQFYTPATHQGYLEPHSCTAAVDPDGRVRIWASTKSPYRLRAQVARACGLPEEQVEVIAPAVGGDFGGKGSPMDAPLCLELARRTGRPVRMTMRYAEELMAGNPRHAAVVTVRAGAARDGRLQALDVHVLYNVGAYAGFRPLPTLHGIEEAGAAYRIPALRCTAAGVYTNQVPGGHKRAPGSPQVTFAVESMLDMLAGRLGLDPVELRRRNLLCTGDATPLGHRWPEARGVDTLEAAVAADRPAFPAQADPSLRFGRGVAVYCRSTQLAGSSLRLRAGAAGQVVVEAGQPEQGGGVHTVLRGTVARELGLDPAQVLVQHVGTAHLPHDDGVGGSWGTVTAAETAHRAAALFLERARDLAAAALGLCAAAVVQHPGPAWGDAAGGRRLGLAELAAVAAAREEELTALVELPGRRGHEEGTLGFCVQIAQVGVDVATGQVHVYEVLTVHDVAAILNPVSHRVQIEGGVAYGLGEALLEDLTIHSGKVQAANLGDYKLPSARDVPPVRVMYLPGGRGVGTHNLKGIGEMSNVAVPAAVANAVADAVGVRICSLPVTAEKIWLALQAAGGQCVR